MTPLVLILVVGGGLAVVLLVVGVVVTVTSEQSLVEERLDRYIEDEVESVKKEGEKTTPVGDWLSGRLEGSSWGDGIARNLARADLKLKTGEYLVLMVIAGIGVGALSWFIGGQSVLFGIMGGLVGTTFPRIYVGRQKSQRLQKFDDQLADMLNLVVNGLRAGFSIMQALDGVSREMPPPISDEFRRVLQEMQLGIDMEHALSNLLRRIPSDDLDLVVTAMNVQREVGGNLAEILDVISHTIRERVRVKGEIRVLTTQTLYSGRFLASMPVLLALILWLINRPYMMEFFNPETRLVGMILLGVAVIMIISGYFVMTRIASIEV